jgi:hypothetical protein
MTVREPQDSTGGVYITPEISSKIDNQKIVRETLIKIEKLTEILDSAVEYHDDKDTMAWHLQELCRIFKYSKDYSQDELALRQIGIVELEKEQDDIATGFYLFLPIMSTEWVKEIMRERYNPEEDETEGSVICWYTSYSGQVSLHVFNYPFQEDTYLALLREFKVTELDNPGDIDALNYISHEIFDYDEFLEFQPNSDIGLLDQYLSKEDVDKGDIDLDRQMSLF